MSNGAPKERLKLKEQRYTDAYNESREIEPQSDNKVDDEMIKTSTGNNSYEEKSEEDTDSAFLKSTGDKTLMDIASSYKTKSDDIVNMIHDLVELNPNDLGGAYSRSPDPVFRNSVNWAFRPKKGAMIKLPRYIQNNETMLNIALN